jgi:hypothetical protein
VAALSLACSSAAGQDEYIKLGGGYTAQIDRKGVVKVTSGKGVVIREAFLGTWAGDDFSDQIKAIKVEGDAPDDGPLMRAGVIPKEGASTTYRLFARATAPDKDGRRALLLTYVVSSPLFEKAKAKAALLVRFPVGTHARQAVSLDNNTAGTFPEKLGKKHLIARKLDAHDLAIGPEDKPALYLGREVPGEILVQDSRKWGADAYEAQFHLHPARSRPPDRRVLQLLIKAGGAPGPVIARLATNRPRLKPERMPALPKFGKFEIRLDLWARYRNQYDSADIRVTGLFARPDRTVRRVRGFYYQPFERDLVRGHEQLTPVGPHEWRVRFTPTQEGTYSFRVEVKTAEGGVTSSSPQKFHVAKPESPGFVHVHRKNPRYFQFSSGKTYFPVGHNVCWGSEDKLSYDYDKYFRRMGQAGENYTRVWMCSWDTGIEGRQLDSYRLDSAWRLDHIFDLAAQRGIYVKLCLDNEHDYTNPAKRKLFGIWKQNGGPCESVIDLFTLPEARAAYKRRLDYIIARWGYSPHLMAWELWNEMNYIASTEPGARDILVKWTEEMAGYLKKHDPYDHMVTTSLGLLTVWDEVWKLPCIDFSQLHVYLPQPNSADEPWERSAVAAVLRAGARLRHFGKPYHVSEFGYLDLHEINRTNEKDSGGVHLHNAIWASLLSGAAATPSIWWWRDYVHEKNLYVHYASAAGFMADIDPADKAWIRVAARKPDKTRVIGMVKHDAAALWVQRTGNNWYRRVQQEKPAQPLETVKLRIPNLEPGKYRVTWWDTSAGKITSYPQEVKTSPASLGRRRGDLVVSYTTGRPDIAVKVRKVK